MLLRSGRGGVGRVSADAAADVDEDDHDDEAVLYEVTDAGVAVITLNRPERLNTWGPDISSGFYACVDRAEADPTARVIVVTGRGRAFCAGASLGTMAD